MDSVCKNYFKAVLIALFSMFFSVIAFICLPQITSAATGTLGSEEPYVYFTYENAEDGVQADGNQLSAGTYNVSVHFSGMLNSSVFQVSATYDTEKATVVPTPVSLLSDTVTDMESMGYVLGDGDIVFGFVSTNDAFSSLGDDVVIAEFTMTFAQDCDAETVITVSKSPDYTFAQADYGDGYNDEYSLTLDSEKDVNYTGTLYIMTCDVTPAFGYDVSASLVVMTNSNGETNNVPVYGEYTVQVYRDIDRTDLVTTVKSVRSENANSFVIEGLTDGTYYATISGAYAITRNDITIVVNGSDIAGPVIPIIACDFNGDKGIGANDAIVVYENAASGNDMFYDLNGDKGIGSNDAIIVYACASSGKVKPITIEN